MDADKTGDIKLAAIAYEPGEGEAVDGLLAGVARRLRAKGVRLAGAIQWNDQRADRCDMALEDLASGQRFAASSGATRASKACRLDAAALEDVAGLVASSIAPGIDLVILNRFGKEEAAGRGFRGAIESAIANDIPVLTSLNRALIESFDTFAGGDRIYLPASEHELERWCASVVAEVS